MSIKVRLLISYIAVLLIPVILLPLSALAMAYIYLGDIQQFYKFDLNHPNIVQVVKDDALVYEEVKETAASNPEKLMDTNYLQQLDKRLEPTRSGLALRKNQELLYVSAVLSQTKIIDRLPGFGYYRGNREDHREQWNDEIRFPIRQFDFYFTDHSQGTIFIITDIGPIGSFLENFLGSLLLIALLIFVITNGLLTYLMSRSIIRPIEYLKEAAGQIKDGNLNFAVKMKSNDELGRLGEAFEEMRSHLKESIESQIQYEENRKELIANISHDLRTPITAIKGYTEGIIDGVADSPEKIEKYIKTIHSKAEDIDRLIDELFLFSKLDLGKEPFSFEKVDIGEYLQHSVEDLQFDLDKKNIKLFITNNTDAPIMVILDREKIKRVMTNIVDNSVKYMNKEQGIIGIELQESGQEITISIHDNGQGIPAPALPFIFERFYRADPSRNASAGSSGLGLAIAHRIIKEHGGNIWAQSTENTGTCISFTLMKS